MALSVVTYRYLTAHWSLCLTRNYSQAFATFSVHETAAWAETPSYRDLRIVGCAVTAQDMDIWPAYALLLLGETSERNLHDDTSIQG